MILSIITRTQAVPAARKNGATFRCTFGGKHPIIKKESIAIVMTPKGPRRAATAIKSLTSPPPMVVFLLSNNSTQAASTIATEKIETIAAPNPRPAARPRPSPTPVIVIVSGIRAVRRSTTHEIAKRTNVATKCAAADGWVKSNNGIKALFYIRHFPLRS